LKGISEKLEKKRVGWPCKRRCSKKGLKKGGKEKPTWSRTGTGGHKSDIKEKTCSAGEGSENYSHEHLSDRRKQLKGTSRKGDDAEQREPKGKKRLDKSSILISEQGEGVQTGNLSRVQTLRGLIGGHMREPAS